MRIEYEHHVGKGLFVAGNQWYVARQEVGSAKDAQYLSADGRWCGLMNSEGVGNAGTYFATKEEAAEMLAKWSAPRAPYPEWRSRPTGPGLWLAQVESPGGIEYLSQKIVEGEDITLPMEPGVLRVYGPIAVEA